MDLGPMPPTPDIGPLAVDAGKLEPIAPGSIPPGRYYVQGTHPDSFDSRYRVNGLIRTEQIVGVAHKVW